MRVKKRGGTFSFQFQFLFQFVLCTASIAQHEIFKDNISNVLLFTRYTKCIITCLALLRFFPLFLFYIWRKISLSTSLKNARFFISRRPTFATFWHTDTHTSLSCRILSDFEIYICVYRNSIHHDVNERAHAFNKLPILYRRVSSIH